MTDALAYDPLARFHDVKVTSAIELARLTTDIVCTAAVHLVNILIVDCEERGIPASVDVLRALADEIARIPSPVEPEDHS